MRVEENHLSSPHSLSEIAGETIFPVSGGRQFKRCAAAPAAAAVDAANRSRAAQIAQVVEKSDLMQDRLRHL
jgi:hypothetical protein